MNTPSWRRWLGLLVAALACAVFAAAPENPAAARANVALVLTIHDAIGPATSSFFVRTLKDARERNARLLVLEMDTPGGLDSAMREMIQEILASPVPVAIYVSPSGARAASAGTYLLYASHVAAMAPATNLGAATPVQIGATPPPSQPSSGDKEKDDKGRSEPEPGTAMERKAVNDSIAYIRGLAELRGRNADWAESAVRSATSLTASDRNSGSRTEGHRCRRNRSRGPAEADGWSCREDECG
jgi:membrane-bound serine protease (ClpP class)